MDVSVEQFRVLPGEGGARKSMLLHGYSCSGDKFERAEKLVLHSCKVRRRIKEICTRSDKVLTGTQLPAGFVRLKSGSIRGILLLGQGVAIDFLS